MMNKQFTINLDQETAKELQALIDSKQYKVIGESISIDQLIGILIRQETDKIKPKAQWDIYPPYPPAGFRKLLEGELILETDFYVFETTDFDYESAPKGDALNGATMYSWDMRRLSFYIDPSWNEIRNHAYFERMGRICRRVD